MNDQLRAALNVLWDIQLASGTNDKKRYLELQSSNETLKDILYFVFNPYIKTGLGWKKFNSASCDGTSFVGRPIQDVFYYIKINNTGKDIDAQIVKNWIYEECSGEINKEPFIRILSEIFTKTLKLGISTTTIHKVWPNLIPGFGVQLACKWQDNFGILEGEEIFVTEKLDGNRCFAHVENHNCTFYSRTGREIDGLSDVEKELSTLADGWYDGELIARSFNETQKQVRKKGTKSDLVFNIFDYVTDQEVSKQVGNWNYTTRRKMLSDIFSETSGLNYVKLVPILIHDIFDKEQVARLLSDVTARGSEGLMINLNSAYQFTRTNQLLKVKNMYTLDLPIIGVSEGRGEFANTAGALIVEYKGYPVGVGSGLSKEDRIYFWNNKEDVVGRIVEIQAFEECHDKFGNTSLRFPVFIRLREKTEVSYE